MKFNNLDDAFDCYGKENIVAIDNLKQIIYYVKSRIQPCFVWTDRNNESHITCWFLKSETRWIYKRWQENKPEK